MLVFFIAEWFSAKFFIAAVASSLYLHKIQKETENLDIKPQIEILQIDDDKT